MSTIKIDLPDQVMSAIDSRAKNSGFEDVNEYVLQFVMQLSVRQSEVEALAIEGLQSGPSEPWNKDEIEDIRLP